MIRLNATARREERKRIEELELEYERRRERFRILVCLDGTEEAYEGVKLAADFGRGDDCDIILLYVRRIDQGLNSGGLQVRVARQNMLDWGLDLPGIGILKTGLSILVDEAELAKNWKTMVSHTDVFGDPLGDNKVEYRSQSGKSIVLKLKVAVDVTSGILDQCEFGPYNLIITGPPKRWRSEIGSIRDTSTVQNIAMMAPCSVLTRRGDEEGEGFLICLDGSRHALEAMRRSAVLAIHCRQTISLISVARTQGDVAAARKRLSSAAAQLETMGLKAARTLVPVGDPVTEIVEAGKDYRFIVVAGSGKSWLKRILAGSVAFKIMGNATTSVLNVR
jgi:nucleotide-binding universal stress UspA family protein